MPMHAMTFILDPFCRGVNGDHMCCTSLSPVVLSVTDSVLDGNFVLATLSDEPGVHQQNPKRYIFYPFYR